MQTAIRTSLIVALLSVASCDYSGDLPTVVPLANVEASPTAPTTTLKPDFRGQVTYDGNYQGEMSIASKDASGVFQLGGGGARLNLNNLFGTSESQGFGGRITFYVEYMGTAVKVTYNSNGGLNSGSITGTRNGDTCVLIDTNGTVKGEWRAHCGTDGFSGTFASYAGHNPSYRWSYQASTTKLVDYVEQENRQAAAKAEQERQQAEADRKSAEFEAYLKTRPPASSEMVAALKKGITSDSRAWLMNRYDEGSLRDVVVLEESPDGRMTLRGNYTFNNGVGGWVQAQLINRRVQCLQYWDTGNCSPIRPGEQSGRTHELYDRIRDDFDDVLELVERCSKRDPQKRVELAFDKAQIVSHRADWLMGIRYGISFDEASDKFDNDQKLVRSLLNKYSSCRE